MQTTVWERVYRQGAGTQNEDRYLADPAKGLYAVVDGATAVNQAAVSGAVAAQLVCDYLASWDGRSPLVQAILAANRVLAPINRDPLRKGHHLRPKEQRSTCHIAAVRLQKSPGGRPGRLEYAHLGDCMVFAAYDDGSLRSLTHDTVSPLDQQVIEKMLEAWQERLGAGGNPNQLPPEDRRCHFQGVRAAIRGLLVSERQKVNSPAGYGILDGSAAMRSFVEHGSLSLSHVRKVLLLTDGLQLPTHKASPQGWAETACYAFTHGLAALERRVLELEAADPACFVYPRLKPADDKTGLLLHLD